MSGETVWLLPRQVSGTDALGNDQVSWPSKDDPAAVRIDGASVGGRVRLDNEPDLPGREAVVEPINVFTTEDYGVRAVDRMWIRGQIYKVKGEPFLWIHNRTRRLKGLQITVERVEG